MSSVISTQTLAPAAMSLASSRRPATTRSPNDIPVNEPSPDIINNLLASLSSIPASPEEEPYSPLVSSRNTSKTFPRPQPPSRAPSAQRYTPPTSLFSRTPSASIDERETLEEVVQDIPIGEVSLVDVAEAPTVRTARRPSGYSRTTTPKTLRKKQNPYNLRGAFAPPSTPSTSTPPSRQTERPPPPLAQLPEEEAPVKTGKTKKASDEARRAAALSLRKRDSLLVTRSREAKGKQRASPPSPLYSPLSPQQPRHDTSRKRTPVPQRPYYSEYASPRRSPLLTPTTENDVPFPEDSSQSLRHQTSNDNFVIVRGKSSESTRQQERRRVIPSRSSSVGRVGRSSRRSSLRSQHRSPETVPEEPRENDQLPGSQPIQDETQEGTKNDANNVMKRIKQLRAAKEQREKSKLATSHTVEQEVDDGTSVDAQSISRERIKPPDTSSALRQLEEAAAIREHEVVVKPATQSLSEQPLSPRSHITNISETPVLMSGEYANLSRPKPAIINSIAADTPAEVTKPSIQVNGAPADQGPFLSRSNSRVKRWSNPNLSSRKNSFQQHIRNRSDSTGKAALAKIPLSEEPRKSQDSVNDAVQDFLNSQRLSQRIQSPYENRIISYSEIGDPHGHAVICCIGMGLTRYITAFYQELATSLKLRLITPERPGIGDSEAYGETRSPLYWHEDVRAICNHLSIQTFSLLAHSAGAIYALATALKMPSRVRGRIHLLAPWIPPSQLVTPPTAAVASAGTPSKAGALPRSQRFLRYVPTSFLRLGSSQYVAGVKPAGTPSPKQRRGTRAGGEVGAASVLPTPRPSMSAKGATGIVALPLSSSRPSVDVGSMGIPKPPSTPHLEDMVSVPSDHSMTAAVLSAGHAAIATPAKSSKLKNAMTPEAAAVAAAWQKRYDAQLTALTWELATRKGNPAVDLIVCLERNNAVGFKYRDVARAVVVHHGSKDSRVPLENVKFLSTQVMQKCELRVLEGEGHSLMANAGVMAAVLGELSKESDMDEDFGNLAHHDSPRLQSGLTFREMLREPR